MKKIFIVGCPRSGTTLLQSLIASHSNVVSFPETHLFSKTIHINKIVRFFSVYSDESYNKLHAILHEFGVDQHVEKRYTIVKTRDWAEILLNALDTIAHHFAQSNEEFLLEKTPRHLHYIDLIHQIEPNAIFIHLIRNGEDVVASLMEATEGNPEQWSGSRSVKKSIYWWNRSIRLSKKYIGQKGHLHVRYENLISDTEAIVKHICTQTGLTFEESMMEKFHHTAEDIISEGEIWKAKNTASEITESKKFQKLPSNIQQQIKDGIIDFDYSKIDINNLS